MKEQYLQTKIKKELTKHGYEVVKLIKTSHSGIPDLMCLKDGQVLFIEVKKEKGVLSTIQKFRIAQLQNLGFNVKIWVDYEKEF